MGVTVKATCSECLTVHPQELELGQGTVKCPVCGHSQDTLPEGEINEIETTCRSQRNYALIALIAFAVAILCFYLWFTKQPLHFAILPQEAKDDAVRDIVLPSLSALGALAGLVFGIMASLRRYIIEY